MQRQHWDDARRRRKGDSDAADQMANLYCYGECCSATLSSPLPAQHVRRPTLSPPLFRHYVRILREPAAWLDPLTIVADLKRVSKIQ